METQPFARQGVDSFFGRGAFWRLLAVVIRAVVGGAGECVVHKGSAGDSPVVS
jgi:hypothetical protein